MLSKLSHIITSVPANGDSSEQELQRSPANTRREQARVRQHSLEESYTALRSASDDDSSIISARRPPLTPSRTGPSNVSWLSVPTDPKLTHSSSAPLIGRSASVTSPKQQAQRPAITNLQARSTHSLRSDYRRTSPIATTSPFVQHQTQLLSPIREQLSPERRPVGLPPISPLREVDVTDDVGARSSPAASYHSSSFFISRPSIQPVDLRPPFSIPPYTSNRSGPLPTIEGSLRKGSTEDGDGSSLRTASFVTAPTVYTYAPSTPSLLSQANKDPYVHDGDEDEDEDSDIGAVRHSGDIRASVISADREQRLYHLRLAVQASQMPSHSPDLLRPSSHGHHYHRGDLAIQPQRSFESSFELLQPPSPDQRNHRASLAIQSQRRTRSFDSSIMRLPLPSPAPSGNSVTEESSNRTSSFIDRRWIKGQSFSVEDIEKLKTLVPNPRKQRGRRAAKLMFWLGFVLGPWCWLIGGWLLDTYGDVELGGIPKSGDVEAQVSTLGMPLDEDKGKSKQGNKGHKYLPLWLSKAKPKSAAHSLDTLRIYPIFAPSTKILAIEKSQPRSRQRGMLYLPAFVKLRSKAGRVSADANIWVDRCRAAAIVSGILLIIVFLAAVVVVTRTR